jgi:hypothetical protein
VVKEEDWSRRKALVLIIGEKFGGSLLLGVAGLQSKVTNRIWCFLLIFGK